MPVPQQMHLSFSEAIEACFTSVKVLDAAGNELFAPGIRADPKGPTSVTVPVRALPAGADQAQ